MKISWLGLRWLRNAAFALLAGMLLAAPIKAGAEEVVIFAAASMTESVSALGEQFERRSGIHVVLSFAGSGVLARQISEGAPANIFLSADMRWLEFLADKDQLVPGSLVPIASNTLVLVAPADSTITERFDFAMLPDLLREGRLAMGDPAHVPVGRYGKAALETLGLWDGIENRTVRLPNVRAVAALVERGEVDFGILYETDYRHAKNIRRVKAFPEDSHPPIVYGMALIRNNDSYAARLFYDFVRSEEGQSVLRRYGFPDVEI